MEKQWTAPIEKGKRIRLSALIVLLVLAVLLVLILVVLLVLRILLILVLIVLLILLISVLLVHFFHPAFRIYCVPRGRFYSKQVRNMDLPKEFLEKLKNFPSEVSTDYLAALEQPVYAGYRVNTLKADADAVHARIGGEPTPFSPYGFYLGDNRAGLGKHPLHHAGAIYIQEPSAMSAVTALDVRPGDKVLDLCAAPGGKSTQIAAALQGEGVLLCNEFVGSRAKILLSNIERMGVSNAVVISAHPDVLCGQLDGFFDKVLVDAPCSGEGMFRKEPAACENWSVKNVEACAARQRKILGSAAKAVKAGGYLAYSTCTFAPEENEGTVAAFLQDHPEFSLCPIAAQFGRAAYPQLGDGNPDLAHCRRVFPMDGGEGHFVALFRKAGGAETSDERIKYDPAPKELAEFWAKTFADPLPQNLRVAGKNVLMASGLPSLRDVHILRDGLLLGEVVKNRFEPAHALFMCGKFTPKQCLDLAADDPRLTAFLRGEQINAPELTGGYAGVRVDGIPCGFGKASNGVLKNHYPKGLRLI